MANPVNLSGKDLNGITAVAAGGSHTVALRSDGMVVAWGSGSPIANPVSLNGQVLTGVTAVSAGSAHTVALKSDGTLAAWGANHDGQITGTPQFYTSAAANPVTLNGQVLTGVTAISAGGFHTVALKRDGTVVVWGRNSSGQTNIRAGLSGVTAIAAGYIHSLALKSDGEVVAWGDNLYGATDVPVDSFSGVTVIAAGGAYTSDRGSGYSAALKTNGRVSVWGNNRDGLISGTPTTTSHSATTNAFALNGQLLSDVTSIAAGGNHAVVLMSDGTVLAWGYNHRGQTVVPTGLVGVTAIAAGEAHTVVLKSDDTTLVGNQSAKLIPTITGSTLTMFWPDTSAGYRIESALSLSPPMAWSNLMGTLQTNGGRISIALPITGTQSFYRLIKP